MFGQVVYELSRGLAFRSISHAGQTIYNDRIPLALAILGTVIYILIPEKSPLLGKDGVLSGALAVIATLPGFYFAGLAAVATFGNVAMDVEMPAPAPEVIIRVNGQPVPHKVTRRQYLSYLFSYLVVLSFAICLIIVFSLLVSPTVRAIGEFLQFTLLGSIMWFCLEAAAVFALLLLCSALAVTTLHGMFFLTEKIHQP